MADLSVPDFDRLAPLLDAMPYGRRAFAELKNLRDVPTVDNLAAHLEALRDWLADDVRAEHDAFSDLT